VRRALTAAASVVLVITATATGCGDRPINAATAADLQSELASVGVDFVSNGPGVPATSNGDIVDRASRGSGLLARDATWVYSGEVAAQGDQLAVNRRVWVVFFPGVEQPLLGAPGTAVSDWVVLVDTTTENVVLATSIGPAG
jgi:hypothetical protein